MKLSYSNVPKICDHPDCAALECWAAALEAEVLRLRALPAQRLLPLNLPLELDDGRQLLVRKGGGQKMICRQKGKGPAIVVGDVVRTIPGKNGHKSVLKAVKRTRKDVTFEILGYTEPDVGAENAAQ